MGAAAPDAPGDGERGATSSKPTTGPRRPIATPLSTPRPKDEPPPTTRPKDATPALATPRKATADDRATLKSAVGIPVPERLRQASVEVVDPDAAPTTLKADQLPAFTDPPPAAIEGPPSSLRGLSASALFERAGARLLERDLEGAEEACAWARRADPDNQEIDVLAIWIRAQSAGADLKTLTIELDELLTAAPDHRNARYHRALLRKRLGDNTGAVRDLRRVLELRPSDAEAAKALEALEGPAEKPRSSLLGWLFKR
jgi:hypothetical protein